jgi:hypothetical protein
MPHILSKLTSCIHRRHDSKSISSKIIPPRQHLLKLSRFELMPDEILIEMLEYLPIIDLYNGFVNLNFRINYLLRNLNVGICLNEISNSNSNMLNSIYYFRKQMIYIHIDHNPLLNFQLFPNLRSLTIYLPTKNQLLSIKSDSMRKLSRLWIGIISQKDENILLNILFGNEEFENLRYCNLFEINFRNNLSSFNCCLNIRTLLISNCTTKDFILILSLLPNLYQLNICITDIFSTSFQNFNHFSHEKLKILKIEFIQKLPRLNILNYLMSFVPYIQRCTLVLINLIKIRDYQNLQNILIQKLLQLEEFICSIDYYCQLSSNRMIPKFDRLKIKLPFFQTINVIPCQIHQHKCVRKTWMNKTLYPID